MRANTTRERLLRGEPAYGVGLGLGSPFAAEILAGGGVDFVQIDARHGSFGAETLSATLAAIASDATAYLRPRIPALTLELAPGVGLAEGTRDAVSFGTHRCGLIAEAVVRAHEQGLTRPAARLAMVADRFAEAGVALDAPYREPALAGRHVL
jgi:hypothetical protein